MPAPAPRERSKAREAVFLVLLAVAAVAAALLFSAAVHPERIHDPRHQRRFAKDCEALPSLGAVRVRSEARAAVFGEFGRVSGLTLDARALFRRSRYLRAGPAEIADAIAALERGDVPTPPPAPDLSRYYRDAQGPYLCDLVLAEGRTPAAVREKVPDASLAGEPVLRGEEDREAAPLVRALLLGLAVLGGWLVWRRGLREAQLRLLAAVGVLVATGLLRTGIDIWSVVALLLVAGAPGGAPLLAAAPCLFFPIPALERLGLVLCLGGALRLLLARPVVPRRPAHGAAFGAAALAVALGALGFFLLESAPLHVPSHPEVAAEPAALFVSKRDVAEAAQRLRAEGLEITGDERLLPPPPEPATRRNLWKLFTRARTLALGSDGVMRGRIEDVADAASQMSFTTLPRDLRVRLLASDGRAVLWAPADAEREELTSARLYRVRGEMELRSRARLAGVLVAVAGAVALAVLGGGARKVLLRFAGAAAGIALLLLADPAGADFYVPLMALAAAAPALGPALALFAASAVYPGLLWPAVGFLVAAGLGYGSIRQRAVPR